MLLVEKLNTKNTEEFYNLLEESNKVSPFRLNYHKFYDNNSFLFKFIIKKLVKLIKYNEKYIGYIWIEVPSSGTIRISDLYIKRKYIHLFNKKTLSFLKSDIVLYETFENDENLLMLETLGMGRFKATNLLVIEPNTFVFSNFNSKIIFKKFESKRDEVLRCKIQNMIFNEESRVPLKVQEIYYDEKQDYYLEDLCVFVFLGNKAIGYGQIIFTRGIYSIVNFGIIEGYRGRGYGRALLQQLIKMAKEKNIEKLYIRVENTNFTAKELYINSGFKEVGKLSIWLWSREVVINI